MNGEREDTVVAGPATVAGAALVLLGLCRRSPLLVFAGAVAIGAGLKLHPLGGEPSG